MRIWVFAVLTIIILLSGVFWLYHQYAQEKLLSTITPNFKPIGVIDMDYDHGVNIDDIKTGEDVILVISKDYPEYNKIMAAVGSEKGRFEIGLDTGAKEGLIDPMDPMWKYLYIIIFSNDGRSYVLKPVSLAGIRGILIRHIGEQGNHIVLLSDGSARTLYEYGKHITLPPAENRVDFVH